MLYNIIFSYYNSDDNIGIFLNKVIKREYTFKIKIKMIYQEKYIKTKFDDQKLTKNMQIYYRRNITTHKYEIKNC